MPVTVAELIALIQSHPAADLQAWLDSFAAKNPDSAAAVAVVKAWVQSGADALPNLATAGLLDVIQQFRDGFGEANTDIGMTQ